MTVAQKRKILERIVKVESDIQTLEEVQITLASSEYASATFSSGGGSKSYTRSDISKITATLSVLKNKLRSLRALISDSSSKMPKQIYQIYF